MNMRSPLRRRGSTWLVSWLIFSVLGGLWALSSPILSVPDESSHAVYAAAATRGQIWEPTDPNGKTTVTLPAGFRNANRIVGCYQYDPAEPAGCAAALSAADGEAQVTTLAGRYPPAYYMYAGLGSLVTDGAKAIYAMRLLTVVLVAAFLASAVCSVLGRPRPALGLVGLGLAATPMLFFFSGAINPQAPEIAAAILLWVSGAGLLRSMRADAQLPLTFGNADLRRVLVAVAALPLFRPLSLLWLALIVGALLLAFGSWSAIRRLFTARAVLVALPVIALTVGSSIVWFLARGAISGGTNLQFADLPADEALLRSGSKLNDEFFEMIGVFGWLTTPAPGLVYVVYTALLGGLVVLTALNSPIRLNVAVALVAVAVVVIPVALEMASYETTSFPWQGRYTLPIAVGIPLLLALGDGAAGLTGRLPQRFLATAAGGLVVVHVLSFTGALNRHVFGIDGFWGVTPPGWSPPLPYSVLVLGAAAVAVAAAVLACRAGRSVDRGGDAGGADEDYPTRPRLPALPAPDGGPVRTGPPAGVH